MDPSHQPEPVTVKRLARPEQLPLFRQSWSLHQQAAALARLRDLVLPRLVTGKIDVSHLDLNALTEAATA